MHTVNIRVSSYFIKRIPINLISNIIWVRSIMIIYRWQLIFNITLVYVNERVRLIIATSMARVWPKIFIQISFDLINVLELWYWTILWNIISYIIIKTFHLCLNRGKRITWQLYIRTLMNNLFIIEVFFKLFREFFLVVII